MARVDITLNGRTFPVACDDGQEDRVRQIARYVDSRLSEIRASGQGATDMHLMVMVSLLIADELMDVRAELENSLAAHPAGGNGNGAAAATGGDPAVSAAMGQLAGRLEAIAARLERA